MNCCELVVFVSLLACQIRECCDDDQVELLAAIFNQLGDTLVTISTCESSCQEQETSQKNTGNCQATSE